MSKLPEFVYLVTVDSEWPVSAIADDHPSTPERIEAEVARRGQSYVHIWRVPVQGAQEVELLPGALVKPSLRLKDAPA